VTEISRMMGEVEIMVRNCSLPPSAGQQGHCSGYYSHRNPFQSTLWKQKFYMGSKVTWKVLGREIR